MTDFAVDEVSNGVDGIGFPDADGSSASSFGIALCRLVPSGKMTADGILGAEHTPRAHPCAPRDRLNTFPFGILFGRGTPARCGGLCTERILFALLDAVAIVLELVAIVVAPARRRT